MEEDKELIEILLELAEEENQLLRDEIQTLKGYIAYLQDQNKELTKQHNSFFDLRLRKN